jgi:hypothetical protein
VTKQLELGLPNGTTNARLEGEGKRKRTAVPNCSSRTEHNTGDKIHKAVKAQQRTNPANHRGRERTPEQLWEEYLKAMAETRAAQHPPGKQGDTK